MTRLRQEWGFYASMALTFALVVARAMGAV